MKKIKKKNEEPSGIAISGLGNATIISRGKKVTVFGDDDSHLGEISVSMEADKPKIQLHNVSTDSIIIVNGKRVN